MIDPADTLEYFDKLHAMWASDDLDRPVSFEIAEPMAQFMYLSRMNGNYPEYRDGWVSDTAAKAHWHISPRVRRPCLTMVEYIQVGVIAELCEKAWGDGDIPIVLPRAFVPAATIGFAWPGIFDRAYLFIRGFDELHESTQ